MHFLFAMLKIKGIKEITQVPRPIFNNELLPVQTGEVLKDSWDWIDSQRVDYVIGGTVEEWQYKSGLDGEPSVSITLSLHDPKTREVIWTGTGSRVGWGRESTSITARKIINRLLKKMIVINRVSLYSNKKNNNTLLALCSVS